MSDVPPSVPIMAPRSSRVADSGWEITLQPMLFGNTRLCVGEPGAMTYEKGYCYTALHLLGALKDLREWDGIGDPPGPWYKSLQTQETREQYR